MYSYSYLLFFRAHLSSLDLALEWVRSLLKTWQVDILIANRTELVLEEALVNIIKHANLSCSSYIQLTCEYSKDQNIVFCIKDYGDPFNPLLVLPSKEFPTTLEERQEGGIGLFLMKNFTDGLTYQRNLGANYLYIRKRWKLSDQ
ncbi:MAG: ATP-binding protein [Rhabdochlamydiaceae bacterium]